MNNLHFSKMHGLGNDFIVVNGLSQSIDLKKTPISELANRHTGIGFDQFLLITSSKKADFGCVIFNADGTEAEQCGNGMRCVARFIHENHLSNKKSISIETKAGVMEAIIHDYDHICINMGMPHFESSEMISLNDGQPAVTLAVLSMGNPHAILPVSSVELFPVAKVGSFISTHPLFPNGTNVGFMEVVTPDRVRLRTFERGVGETLACGSNACAAVVAGINDGILAKNVRVELVLGDLQVEWDGESSPVMLTGPAAQVFSGEVTL